MQAMKLAMIFAVAGMGAFGLAFLALWTLDCFFIGEFQEASVPAGRTGFALLIGAGSTFRAVLQDKGEDS